MCWLRGRDLNPRPLGYEPNELPDCSTPRQVLGGPTSRLPNSPTVARESFTVKAPLTVKGLHYSWAAQFRARGLLPMRHILPTLCVVALCLTSLATRASAETTLVQLQGKPKFSEGDALGYFVWKDGDTWKVRWTTFGAEHVFNGRVTLEGGDLRDFKAVDVDTERRVLAPGRAPRVVRGPRGRVRRVAPGRRAVVAEKDEDYIEQESERIIRFRARTDDDIDGFDFKTTGSVETIRFLLQIDERSRPEEIEVGRDNTKPGEDPLVVRLR